MRKRNLCWSFAAALLVWGCGGNGSFGGNNPYSAETRSSRQREEALTRATKALEQGAAPQVTESINDLGLKLFQRLSTENDKNVFVSPVSISTALTMTFNGAGGDTRKAMSEALGLGKLNHEQVNSAYSNLRTVLTSLDDKVQLQIANALFAREGVPFNGNFLKRNEDYFGAHTSTLDFSKPEAKNTINDWVRESTGGKIKEIVSDIPQDAVLYLMNAVYFKGLWSTPFKKEDTKDENFTLADGKAVKAPMMTRSGKFAHYKGDGVEMVSLPYGSGRIDMVVVLPDKGVAPLLKNLNGKNWSKWTSALSGMDAGSVTLPRFKSEFEAGLKDDLSKLGMSVAFQPGKADFSGMRDQKDLFIQEVKHKTFIEVNEEGTEAAAATGVQVGATSVPAAPFKFRADRPFVYAIRDTQTGVILFMGVLRNPSNGNR
jgi:serine protease inhibitor